MTKYEKMLKELITLYGVNGIKAALMNYNINGGISLKAVNDISDEMIDDIFTALYDMCDDLGINPGNNIKIIKDNRRKGEQYVSIQFKYGWNINFRITDDGKYSLVHMTGMGKAISRDPDFETCLTNFINKFRYIAARVNF